MQPLAVPDWVVVVVLVVAVVEVAVLPVVAVVGVAVLSVEVVVQPVEGTTCPALVAEPDLGQRGQDSPPGRTRHPRLDSPLLLS